MGMILIVLFAAEALFAAPKVPLRGYLDRKYSADTLNGRSIYFQGLTRANAEFEKILDFAKEGEDLLMADSLFERFNSRVAAAIKLRLAKADVHRPDPTRP